MSHTNRMEKIQLAAMALVSFGLLALAIPMVCHQLVPTVEVQAFEAPGRNVLKLAVKGPYVLYYERFLDDDKAVQDKETAALPKLKVEISKSDLNRGWPLPISAARDEYLYRLGNRKGISLYTFHVPAPGEYAVKTYYTSGDGPDIRIAVGQETLNNRRIRMVMMGLIAAVSVSMVFTVILFIVKLTKS